MHELGLSRSIVAIVKENAGEKPVARVKLAIGPMVCVEPQSLKFCWDIVIEGTTLEGAKLEIAKADADTFLIKEYELKEIA